jgi:hypothetical protein
LDDLITLAERTYSEAASGELFLQQLTFFKDTSDINYAIALLSEPETFEAISDNLTSTVRSWIGERYGDYLGRI